MMNVFEEFQLLDRSQLTLGAAVISISQKLFVIAGRREPLFRWYDVSTLTTSNAHVDGADRDVSAVPVGFLGTAARPLGSVFAGAPVVGGSGSESEFEL